jgi:hypothetical protein
MIIFKKNLKHMHLFIVCVAGLSMMHSPLAALKPNVHLSPLQKISQSFSNDKLGRMTMPKGAKLMQTEANNPECSVQKLADCYVRDVNGVELYFSPYDGLNSKQITISASHSGAVRALGIGTARSKTSVLAAIERFVQRLSFECAETGQDNGEVDNDLTCSARIPDKSGAKANPDEQDPSTVELVFGSNNRIKSALVRHSNFID